MNVAIIGAGVAGLSAALDLRKAGCSVTIYEAADKVGGLAAGFRCPRWEWSVENYYHHWFSSDRHLLGLIDELGLSRQVILPRPMTAVYYNEKFYPLDSAVAVLRFPGLPLFDRIRLGLVVAMLKLLPNGLSLEKVTADSWMRRWVGKRAYETVWEPMLIGKFGPHYKDVNMAWFWARFKARTPRLGTYEGGIQAFLDVFSDRLQIEGVDIRLNATVKRIEPTPEGKLRLTFSDTSADYDRCLATTSPKQMALLTPALSEDYRRKLLSLTSMGALVLILALKHQLSKDGIYWHNLPKSAGFPFLAMVEHTNYLSPEHFDGDHILYCGDYLDLDHEYFSLTKEELLNRFLPALSRVNPDFKPDWVKESWLIKTEYAQPVPMINHSQAIPAIKTSIPGLWFASMSQVYPWDRGTNYAVEIGRRAAREMLEP